jgi:hypothetical protein
MADETKSIELWPCGYDARCNVRKCKARATTLARSTDSGGRPLKQYELCSCMPIRLRSVRSSKAGRS